MDSLWTSASTALGTYFNISLGFLLRTCHQTPRLTPEDLEAQDGDGENVADLSSNLNEVISWLLGGNTNNKAEVDGGIYTFWEEHDDCQDVIHSSFDSSVSAISVVKIFVGVPLGLCLTAVILCRLWNKVTWHRKDLADTVLKAKGMNDRDEQIRNENQKELDMKTAGAVCEDQEMDQIRLAGNGVELRVRVPKPLLPVGISLASLGSAIQNLEPLLQLLQAQNCKTKIKSKSADNDA